MDTDFNVECRHSVLRVQTLLAAPPRPNIDYPFMKPVIAVVGPTASGKTRRAVELARALGTEIISADSRQVYRGMTLGTGKDLDEYGDVPYHLIDIADAGGKYNLHRFVRDYEAAERDMRGRGLQPLLCGGSGMYVETVLAGIRLPEVPENKEPSRLKW